MSNLVRKPKVSNGQQPVLAGTAVIPHSVKRWLAYKSFRDIVRERVENLGLPFSKGKEARLVARIRDKVAADLRRKGLTVVMTNDRRLLDWKDPVGFKQPEAIRVAVFESIVSTIDSAWAEREIVFLAAQADE
ncbi:MAG: hypothetical protein KatS3mg109_0110 [Pirellulaceae bacterium]|nr:MAG: hypothetical protein KatS3mg109_0110 [Pirellulaceae bacterium]